MATHIGYSVPKGSLEFWKIHLQKHNVSVEEGEVFGEKMISFKDPDGLQLQFIEPATEDHRKVWTTEDIKSENALKGFHNVTLTLKKADPTIKVLTDILGYDLQKQEGERYRFATNAIDTANFIDIIENNAIPVGQNAAGTNHHIAFRVENDQILMEYREKVMAAGLSITPKIDRDYFYSLYFREPGGVLFEIATDNPGFTVDEPLEELGTHLRLPKQHEGLRAKIEEVLPKLS
ncbi:ring-cleaving dioxygenase [Chryseobacterium soli]|uniref:ring-cleaving dioxygenase n=1 Tax=Chryseobacterium soli TaxID=445961 RepID=UPI0029533DBD|nr:ring-cleaving dioxygenase [Chryseobacterium soli]MDV7698824.1 ring-cleaving dioxygenase [Chryseobacterium soli]